MQVNTGVSLFKGNVGEQQPQTSKIKKIIFIDVDKQGDKKLRGKRVFFKLDDVKRELKGKASGKVNNADEYDQYSLFSAKTLMTCAVAVLISIVVLRAIQSESIPAFIETTKTDLVQSIDSHAVMLERLVDSLAYFSDAVEFVIRMTLLHYFN